MLKTSDYQILIYICSLVSSDFKREIDSSKIVFYIRRLSMMTFVNDLFSFLFLCYDKYIPPAETDTIGMLIPRWMGAGMVVFNIVYKFEYFRETPFAWLDIYFTSSSKSVKPVETDDLTFKKKASLSSNSDLSDSDNNDSHDSLPSIMDQIPHPNYSIGCIGYYGMALYTQSYSVLFSGIFHHAAHILFLFQVERPVLYKLLADREGVVSAAEIVQDKEYYDALHLYFDDDLIIFKNLDLFRSADAITVFVMGYTIVTAYVLGSGHERFFMLQALFWRVFHTYVLGFLLYKQKTSKFWTRYFLRRGDGVAEAFKHWKLLHNLSLTMTYCSFFICGYSYYKAPMFSYTDPQLLRHIIGSLFILLHVWMTGTVYRVTGPLAWFHAEFFIDMPTLPTSMTWKRTKQSPFKYFEHPLLYTFSCWGVVLICERWELFWFTLFGQISHIVFLIGVKGGREENKRTYSAWIAGLIGIKIFTNDRTTDLNGEEKKNMIDKSEDSHSSPGKSIASESRNKKNSSHFRESSVISLASSVSDHLPQRVLRNRRCSLETDNIETTDVTFQFSDEESENDSYYRDLDESEECDSSNNGSGLASPSRSMAFIDDRDSYRINSTIKRVVEELESLVGNAKPHVEKLVQKTRRSVVNLANATRMEDTLSLGELPIALYSLKIAGKNEENSPYYVPSVMKEEQDILEIPFGSPICVQFTGCRETMKRKDWIGIYPLEANFDPNITTSTCGSKWAFLAGSPPKTSPSNAARLFKRTSDRQVYYGESLVTLTKSSIPGLRIVTGQIVMNDLMIPWRCGVYEIRYHHDGKYNVITRSKPFRIVLPILHPSTSISQKNSLHDNRVQFVFEKDDFEMLPTDLSSDDIIKTLLPLVKTCLSIPQDEHLDIEEGMLARTSVPANYLDSGMLVSCVSCIYVFWAVSIVKYRKLVAQRIVYVIAFIFNVDFSWKAVENLYSISQLASRVHEALTVL